MTVDKKEYKAVLLVIEDRIGEVRVRGVFDTVEEAHEYADEELGRAVTYEVQNGRKY